MTLTRRDRVALSAMLEALRDRNADDEDRVAAALKIGWILSEDEHENVTLAYELRDAVQDVLGYTPPFRHANIYRLLRARLALCIRAVLRADAGDFGPRGESPVLAWLVHRQGTHGEPRVPFREWVAANAARWSRRIRPLWELAPSSKEKP